MDPLSIAASAAGLVALAAKVSVLAAKIRDDIKLFSPGGKGFERLSAVLGHVASICLQVKSVLEVESEGDLGVDDSADITLALQSTEAVLALVEAEIVKTRKLPAAKRTILILQRKLKAEHLHDFERQLDSSLGRLKDYILIHHWRLLSRRTSAAREDKVQTTVQVETTVDVSTAVIAAGDANKKIRPATRRVQQETTLFTSRYLGKLKHTSSKRVSRPSSNDALQDVENTNTYGFQLPGFSRSLEFQYRHGLFVPLSFGLRMTHILEGETWESLKYVVFDDGTIPALQALLTSGKVSLYSRSYFGESLLHMAVAGSNPEYMRFLLENDTTGDLMRACPEGPSITWTHPARYDEVLDLITSRGDFEFDTTSFEYLCSCTDTPSELLRCYQMFIREDPDNALAFTDIAWNDAIAPFVRSFVFHPGKRKYAPDSTAFAPLFRSLIKHGADPHRGIRSWHCGSLHSILNMTMCPLLSDEVVHEWLEILESSGVDVAAYLEREVPRCMEPPFLSFPTARVVVPHMYGRLRGLAWVWEFEEASSAAEVLLEFRSLASFDWNEPNIWDHGSAQEWKHQSQLCCWPFVVVSVAKRAEQDPSCEVARTEKWWPSQRLHLPRAIELYFERFERRQAKRMSKGHKRYKKLDIPGAWVE